MLSVCASQYVVYSVGCAAAAALRHSARARPAALHTLESPVASHTAHNEQLGNTIRQHIALRDVTTPALRVAAALVLSAAARPARAPSRPPSSATLAFSPSRSHARRGDSTASLSEPPLTCNW